MRSHQIASEIQTYFFGQLPFGFRPGEMLAVRAGRLVTAAGCPLGIFEFRHPYWQRCVRDKLSLGVGAAR